MAIQIIAGASLEQLATDLAIKIRDQERNIFQPVHIVTQTEGMNNWLKINLASKNGIAANIRFLKPNELISKLYYSLGATYKPVLSAEEQQWILFKVLNEKKFIESFPKVSRYYTGDVENKAAKRMSLARKIADLFDQYQIYRTDIISKWNKNELYFSGNENETWQQYLWISSRNLLHDHFPDKLDISNFIQEQAKDAMKMRKLQADIPVIYFFGISLITEFHLNILRRISGEIDIKFFILNPALSDYWFDDLSEKKLVFYRKTGKVMPTEEATGNALLLLWGRVIQDSFSLLFKDDDIINNYSEIPKADSLPLTLLSKVQDSINQYYNLNNELNVSDLQDGSIVINSCYNPVREVQVLYNYLVKLFLENGGGLSTRDILVMVSDIDLYAAYVQSVFDNAPYKFHYTIADEHYALRDSISSALQAILKIDEENFDAELLLRLLDYSSVRQKFNISNVALLRRIIKSANIRFGIHGNIIDDTRFVSWKYGAKKIMFGACMFSNAEFSFANESFYPVNEVEGYDAFEVIKFISFIEALIASIEKRKQNRSISEWVKYVDEILHDFVCDKEENNDEDYLVLMKELENYNLLSEAFNENIAYSIFVEDLLKHIDQKSQHVTYAQHGITFCSFIPMRSIPFKVIALLGMDNDKFPRRNNELSFNLMSVKPRRGDRSVKDNDNHLFLETLLSAGENLYISYSGQSVKDNSPIPPAIVVDELLDYIQSAMTEDVDVKKQLIQLQPLHNYSGKYNREDDKLYNFLLTSKEQKDFRYPIVREVEFDFSEIDIQHFERFLSNPVKGYFNRVLGIYYNDEEVLAETTEKFELNKLEQSQTKNKLLRCDNDLIEQFVDSELKKGHLPLKNMASASVMYIQSEIKDTKEIFESLVENKQPRTAEIDLRIDDTILKGRIDGMYDDQLIITSFSSKENKYLFRGFLHYLLLTASGESITLYFISREQGMHQAQKLKREDAIEKLSAFITFYKHHHTNFSPFFFEFESDPGKVKAYDFKSFTKQVVKIFADDHHRCYNEYANSAYRKGLYDLEESLTEFQAAAELMLLPLQHFYPTYNFKKK